jgi:hypothetical protein
MSKPINTEGLQFTRLMMILSSFSPLFILWAIRGTSLIPNVYFILSCSALVIIPNIFLWLRISTSRKLKVKRVLNVGMAEDHRDHLLIYLFAVLLPLYVVDLNEWREFAAASAALIFIIFLFWHLNLHYMNLVFAVLGYRVFILSPKEEKNQFSGKEVLILISRQTNIPKDAKVEVYRLSNTVYFEVADDNEL